MAGFKQPNDMEHVWKDISETWERLTGEAPEAENAFALTREIDEAGKLTDDIVDRIYARYDLFGPTFYFPISAQFKNGQWYRQGTDRVLEGVTKYMHIPAPDLWG